MDSDQIHDVLIIGGGPAGLFSAFYSGLRQMRTKIIEYHPFLGGKVNVYPQKMIWDIGGLVPITGAKLIEQMVQQGKTFSPDIVLGQKATSIAKNNEGLFVVKTSENETHFGKTIILAVGGGILNEIKLEIPGAERFETANLHYTVPSLDHFKGKTVLISGGGNSAIDWANELEPIAKKIYLTYRRDMLKGHEAEISRLFNSSAACLLNTTIEKLIANDQQGMIEKVELYDHEQGREYRLAIDEVIVNHGYEWDRELIENSSLDIKMAEGFGVAGSVMSETSVPGLYAAGDILSHEGKLHLIAGAFQDAANAVNKAKQFLHPDAANVAMVSSHNKLLKERNLELNKHLYTKET